MRHYESTIVLDPVLQDDGYNKQMDRIKKFIEERGGNVLHDDRWGLRSLAYEINKQKQGYYGILEWESSGEVIGELDHMLRLDEHIMRHLILYLDPKVLEIREELKLRRASRIQTDGRDERSIQDDKKDKNDAGSDSDGVDEVKEAEQEGTEGSVEEMEQEDTEGSVEETEQEDTEGSVEEAEQEDTEGSVEETEQEDTEGTVEETEQEDTEGTVEETEQDEEGMKE